MERCLLGMAMVATAGLALLLALGLAMTGTPLGLDSLILAWSRSVTGDSGLVVSLAKGVTAFGNDVTLWIVTLIGAGYFVASRNRRAALHLATVAGTGGLLTATIKLLVARPRPNIVQHLVEVHPPSFPSGHAMNSAVVYGTLAVISIRTASTTTVRRYLAVTALLMTASIGTSRLILGVHYPTDVLSGWALGAAWVLVCERIAAGLSNQPTAMASGPEPKRKMM